MVCRDGLLPLDCKSFVELESQCDLGEDVCDPTHKDMEGGIVVILGSFISIILHFISVFNLSAYIKNKKYCKSQYACFAACSVHVTGFSLWVYVSDFKLNEYSANYGLTATFAVIFLNLFLTLHFFKFKKYLLEYYPVKHRTDKPDPHIVSINQ